MTRAEALPARLEPFLGDLFAAAAAALRVPTLQVSGATRPRGLRRCRSGAARHRDRGRRRRWDVALSVGDGSSVLSPACFLVWEFVVVEGRYSRFLPLPEVLPLLESLAIEK